ncbi:MAG: NAD(P)-dependent alcohol dehydrogenase [Myxococcales bacterium]|nr:NAD(P)-dependent alcohol dehydrogenase [Myxococcales bacterium]
MNSAELGPTFGLGNIRWVSRPVPTAGHGEVLVEMSAASLNYRDVLMAAGLYNRKQKLPLVPLSDGVGHVVGLGPGVTRFRGGERVCPIFAQGWLAGVPTQEKLKTTLGGPLDGVCRQFAVFHEAGLVVPPDYLSDEEAATLPCAALTAWNSIVTFGRVKAGDVVVIQGTGGVALFALQFARLHGARVVVLSGTDEKLERAKDLGASLGFNYNREPDWHRLVRDVTDGEGADLIIEVGGAKTLGNSLRAAKIGGTICIIGILSGATTDVMLTHILMHQLRLQGVIVGHRESFEQMNRALIESEIHPVIDEVIDASQITAAFERMPSGKHFGKIVLDLNSLSN